MGTINCCVDTSAVDELAYSTCESTSASELVVTSERIDPTDASITKTADANLPEAPLEEFPEVPWEDLPEVPLEELPEVPTTQPEVTVPVNVYAAGRHSESAVTEHKRVHREQKKLAMRCTQSLEYARPEPTIWLSDYLCPCDPCPHSVSADRLLDAFYRNRQSNDNVQSRHSLHRILRACGAFDECTVPDLDHVERADQLLEIHSGDEGQVFCVMVAFNKNKQTPPFNHVVPLESPPDTATALMRRTLALTA